MLRESAHYNKNVLQRVISSRHLSIQIYPLDAIIYQYRYAVDAIKAYN